MPDWSYQTVFRPILFRMKPTAARDLALTAMGTLSRLPWGTKVIAFMGHMRPDRRLRHSAGGVEFPSRVGVGGCVDRQLLAPRALAQFGIAFLEIGPITVEPVRGGEIERDDAAESIVLHVPRENPGLEAVAARLDHLGDVPVLLRLSDAAADAASFERDAVAIIERLGSRLTGVVLEFADPAASVEPIRRLAQRARSRGLRLVLLAVPASVSDSTVEMAATLVEQREVDGVFVDGAISDLAGRRRIGRENFAATPHAVRRLRGSLPPGAVIVAGGGLHEPVQALDLLAAGSDLVCVDTGLIFSGPGLPKRINEAVLFHQAPPPDVPVRAASQSWFWTCLMAIGMLVGGGMALAIAATRVVMPYDEAASGLTRPEIHAINDRLLHFMQHDRVTLAGTMLAVGILYLAHSLYGSRQGMHWAHVAIVASAFAGFFSFFLFLGFGYFDPFHAFVTGVLLQLLLLAVHGELPPYRNPAPPDLTNDRAWRMSQWGQLAFIVHGAVLVVAGCVISAVGITSVFVPEDLEFMHTTADHLAGAHPQLVPLVAHDRATFGGMLIACGVCVLLSSLWGFRRGHAWQWWSLVLAGVTAYVATILVHWHVGYSSLKHLLPAYGGLGMIVLGGALSWKYLCGSGAERSPGRGGVV